MPKNPTLKQKVQMYEAFLHKINMACICMDDLRKKFYKKLGLEITNN
jgi:hypothetical protein